jgi:hypothetical protein
MYRANVRRASACRVEQIHTLQLYLSPKVLPPLARQAEARRTLAPHSPAVKTCRKDLTNLLR